MIFRAFLLITAFFLPVSVSYALEENRPIAPEIATGINAQKAVAGEKIMAVTANPEATKVAFDILKRGGTAADAAIAAQMILGLVEPQSSGIGGGGFTLYYDAKKKYLITLDGRETAPSTAGSHLFMGEDGKPLDFYDAAIGGRSVGTPGTLRMLEKLHDWQGKLPWGDLFAPAIKLAETGFVVSPRLSQMLQEEKKRGRFSDDVIAKLYFYPDSSTPLEAGEVKRNPDYAITLRNIAQNGVDAFYKGQLAQEIAAKVQDDRFNHGLLSTEDLSSYEVKERKAVCGNYRGYKVCSMGEPSSGGLTLLMILGMLENFDLAAWGPNNPTSWHVIAEASRLAFADRNQYMADPDFVQTPDTLLLNAAYLKKRAQQIKLDKPMQEVSAGVPPGWDPKYQRAADSALKPPGTTHLSIVDQYGNVLSMTSSIENAFGSRLMVGGFLLNNQLTDFAFDPIDESGLPVANRVEGGKRPRSSMAPTIVFDPQGKPFLVIGSAGGSRIIGYVLQRIVSVIDWGIGVQGALAMPNIVHRGEKLELEKSGVKFAVPLKNIGHPVLVGDMNSGLTAIQFKNGFAFGAADPRREGQAMGE
ncbi:MAG TPA: gamma-glutamyltransferase [Alphaproteobacteria bacterium]|nr:gamma-glutamyltransferase [Alphaproteobacteria bacterium]